ncbi:MAG: lysylphosphatidylglycerol synthase transmembrane domain-containing protein [Acidobacteriota bacterium]
MLKKKWLMFFLRISVSVLIIGYSIKLMVDKYGGLGQAFDHFAAVFADVLFVWIFPAFLLHFVGMGLMSLRWKVLLSAQDVNAGYGQLYSINLMAAFFNNFLPSTIGGDMVKALESKRIVGDHTRSVMVIVIERLTGLFALAFIALTAFLIKGVQSGGEKSSNPVLFAAIITLVILILIILSHPGVSIRIIHIFSKFLPGKLFSILERGVSAMTVYYKFPRQLMTAVLISILFQFNMVVYYYLISRALGMNPGFIDFMSKAPMLIFLLMTVPSVNGIGVRTAVFRSLMKFPMPVSLAVEVVDIGMRLVLGLVGGGFFLFHKRGIRGRVKE